MKQFFTAVVLVYSLFCVAAPVLAAPNIGFEDGGLAQKIGGGAGYDTSSGETGLSTTVGKIIRVMLSLSGTVFLALTVYGGIRWMLARGDEGEIGASKEIIKAAIIGLAISLSAYALTSFVVNKITSSTGADQVGGASANSNSGNSSAVLCTDWPLAKCVANGKADDTHKIIQTAACKAANEVCLQDIQPK